MNRQRSDYSALRTAYQSGQALQPGHARNANTQSQENARNAVAAREHKFQIAGGGELKVSLPPGVKHNVLSDGLVKAIDEAKAKSPELKTRRIIVNNTDSKARLNRPMQGYEVSGFTPAKLSDHGINDIHFNNASGRMPTSKHGDTRLTVSNSNFDHSDVSRGVTLRAVGDNVSMNSSRGKISGEILAHSANSTFTGGKNGLGVKGPNVDLAHSAIAGKTKTSVEMAVDPMAKIGHGPAIVYRGADFNPRKSAYEARQAKFGALPAPTGSIHARKKENQFPQLNAA